MLSWRAVERPATPATKSRRSAPGPLRPLPLAFYRRPAEEVARELLGRYLVRRSEGAGGAGEPLVLRLVEVEAYLGAPDRASHAWGGRRTARNASLYLPGGHAYVYFIYGMHWCLNAVTGEAGTGGAVLLRAGEPLAGEERMRRNRGLAAARPGDLAGGPGKLCRALGIDRAFDGLRLDRGLLQLAAGEPVAPGEVAAGPRIGVAYAGEAASWPLRFAIRGNPHVSRPRPGPPP
ncbi:MAG: DNA-3-methyladenine glycosylase [Acidobacteria bacterium]|nr:DNA-3-methyladenine glycosylase [Acidobacteriota bacterium]